MVLTLTILPTEAFPGAVTLNLSIPLVAGTDFGGFSKKMLKALFELNFQKSL